jgi:hypothetical protein
MATKKVVFEIDIKGSKQVFELQEQIKKLKKDIKATDDPNVADQLIKRPQYSRGKTKRST